MAFGTYQICNEIVQDATRTPIQDKMHDGFAEPSCEMDEEVRRVFYHFHQEYFRVLRRCLTFQKMSYTWKRFSWTYYRSDKNISTPRRKFGGVSICWSVEEYLFARWLRKAQMVGMHSWSFTSTWSNSIAAVSNAAGSALKIELLKSCFVICWLRELLNILWDLNNFGWEVEDEASHHFGRFKIIFLFLGSLSKSTSNQYFFSWSTKQFHKTSTSFSILTNIFKNKMSSKGKWTHKAT